MTAPNSWPGFHRKTGAKVDYQVAASTETSTPTMHRATIAQQRVRMEGWRQERLGSRAGTHREEEKNKNILTRKKERKKERKTYLTLTGLLMEGVERKTFFHLFLARRSPVRDIEKIIQSFSTNYPTVRVRQLEVSHPRADDDGLWFFQSPDSEAEVQGGHQCM